MIEKVDILRNLCITVGIAALALYSASRIVSYMDSTDSSSASEHETVDLSSALVAFSDSNTSILSTNGITKCKLLGSATKAESTGIYVRPLPFKTPIQDDLNNLDLALTFHVATGLLNANRYKTEFDNSKNSDSSYSYFMII